MICILVPDGYAFYEISPTGLLPRSHLVATCTGLPYKPRRVACPHTVSPAYLIRTYARRRGLKGLDVQVLDPLGIQDRR